MPLLKRKDFERASAPEKLRDDEEVFYCEATKEVFRNYEDYFERVMLTSSMVWTCQFTGKPNLTYSEALDSEREAKSNIKHFPKPVRGPLILVTSMTKRSALSELMDDVFNYMKDRFFVTERVDVQYANKYRCCTVTEVIAPSNTNTSSPVKHDKFRYKVKAVDEKQPQEWVAMPENIKRDKGVFTKDKCKLFLKQHIENSNNMLKVKDSSYKKYVTDQKLIPAEVFVGKPPDFQLSKRLVELQEKEAKKKEGPTKKSSKKSTSNQQSIQKYLNKSDPGTKPKVSEKQRQEDSKKLKEEMERLRKEKEEREAERKKRQEEEKAELNAQVTQAIKDLNVVREDLELTDQRVLPKPTKIQSLIGDKRFGSFVQILEFLHTFSELLSIKDKFPHGVTMSVLERALLLKEVNGPLTDILQVLLSTIFSLQIEEANEVAVTFDPTAELSTRRADAEVLREASRVGIWCEKYYSTHLNELAMDTHTLSELIRLHFLASGGLISGQGSNWRYQHRGGYLSHDDPGFQFCADEPHIIRALATYSVFELPQGDVIKIIRCLMDQILSYSSVRDLIEERLEKAQKAKYTYRMLCYAEKRREEQLQKDKREMREEIKKVLKEFTGPKSQCDALKVQRNEEMEKKFVVMDRASELEKAKFEHEAQRLKEEFFDYQVFLGSDRAGRSYWLFESLPGLFVEHDTTFAGKCADTVVEHNPGLASCPAAERNKYIRQMVIDKKNNDKENKTDNVKVNGVVNKEKPPQKLSQAELMMCTTNPATCPLHAAHFPDRANWAYFHTEAELDALIAGLNPRGFREKPLRENLELERELIIAHITQCQPERFIIDDHVKCLTAIVEQTAKKYPNPNLNFEEDANISQIFDARLREDLLEFEFKLNHGYLGTVKVMDRHAWRAAIESFSYDAQTDSLNWGPDKKLYKGKLANGHADSDVESGDDKNDSKETEDTETAEDARYGKVYKDPGHNLGDKQVLESEDSQDEGQPLHESVTLKEKVQTLASALLQIEQGIDGKFIRCPFGPKRDGKQQQQRFDVTRKNKLERWEESLMRSTTYSQVSLHYNVLYDAVAWSRSAARQLCYVCRRAKDPEYTLLCDECNRGYHTYCLKPKLKQIPEGDWYCPKCRPENYVVKRGRKRRIFTENEDEEVEDQNGTVEEKPARRAKRSKLEIVEDEEDASPAPRKQRKSNARNSRKRESRRVVELSENEDDDDDDEPLVVRPRRASRKKSVDNNDDDDDVPLGRTRRSRKRKSESSEDESVVAKRRGGSRRFNEDENLTLHAPTLYTLLDDISKHNCSWPFNRPVSLKEVPDYNQIIKNPMDFAKIKSRLNMGDYKTDYDLINDIHQLFANCDLYNSSESEIYKAGIELEKFVKKKCKEYKLPFRPSDMVNNEDNLSTSDDDEDDDDEALITIKRKNANRKRTI